MNNDNLDIFICAHKDFIEYPTHPVYKIVTGVNCLHNEYRIPIIIENDAKYTHLNKCMNEFTRIYYIAHNYDLKKYVGICHYSRFFDFYDNVPNIDEIFKNHDIIIKTPIGTSKYNVLLQYAYYHNISDYCIIRDIIRNEYNVSLDEIKKCEDYLISCNMFIMRSDMFKEYIKFVENIIDKYLSFMRFNTCEDIINYVESNTILYYKQYLTLEYQYRIPAFLIERITNIFIKMNCKNIYDMGFIHKNANNNDMSKYIKNIDNNRNIYHMFE